MSSRRRSRRSLLALLAAVLVAVLLVVFQDELRTALADSPDVSTAPGAEIDVTLARAQLSDLVVKGRSARTGYDRDEFGPAWTDVDGNGCSTREDVLTRDLSETARDGCAVLRGVLDDPYTGERIDFVRGVDTSAEVQIDHVVALSNAWQTGAAAWTDERREAFANDPRNLLAVDGPTNGAKGDGDAATWLPPRSGFRCAYVARQVAVKHEWGLWVTPPEHAAIEDLLTRCA